MKKYFYMIRVPDTDNFVLVSADGVQTIANASIDICLIAGRYNSEQDAEASLTGDEQIIMRRSL